MSSRFGVWPALALVLVGVAAIRLRLPLYAGAGCDNLLRSLAAITPHSR